MRYGTCEYRSTLIRSQPSDLELPEEPIPLLSSTVPLAIGTEDGWLVFRRSLPAPLFLRWQHQCSPRWRHADLIDGVAINGVSGGPVVYSTETEGVQIVGTISAYISNKATGDPSRPFHCPRTLPFS